MLRIAFFVADGEEIESDKKAYDALYGGAENYRIDQIADSDAEEDGFIEYSVSVPMVEMITFDGKYPSAYVLSFLSFAGNEVELYYDAVEDITSVIAPRHICERYLEIQKNYWNEFELNQEQQGIYYN